MHRRVAASNEQSDLVCLSRKKGLCRGGGRKKSTTDRRQAPEIAGGSTSKGRQLLRKKKAKGPEHGESLEAVPPSDHAGAGVHLQLSIEERETNKVLCGNVNAARVAGRRRFQA